MNQLEHFLKSLDILDLIKFLLLVNQSYHRCIDNFNRVEDDDYPNKWKEYLEISEEEIIIAISNIFDYDIITKYGIDKIMSHASYIIFIELEANGYKMNRQSPILKQYPVPNDIRIYYGMETDKVKCDEFYNSYSYDEKFNNVLDKELAEINFEMINDDDFIYASKKEVDNYERKHFKIEKLFRVWDIYKNLEESDKVRFFDEIIMKNFIYVNWRTVSRLFNTKDEEFIEKFNSYIDWDFAKQYHPDLKNSA